MHRAPGLAKARRSTLARTRGGEALTREAEEALFALSDRMTEGALATRGDDEAWFGTTMFTVPLAELEASGAVEGMVKRERSDPGQAKFVNNPGEIAGKVGLSLGVEAGVLGKDIINIELSAGGDVKISAGLVIDDRGIAIDPKADFSGLEGNAKIKFLWGILDINEKVVLVGPRPGFWDPEPIYILTN